MMRIYLKVEQSAIPQSETLLWKRLKESVHRATIAFSHLTDPSIFMSEPDTDDGYPPQNNVFEPLGAQAHKVIIQTWPMIRNNWHLGLTAFGGPPVHFKIGRKTPGEHNTV